MLVRPLPAWILAVVMAVAVFASTRDVVAQDASDRVYVVAHGDSISTIAQHLGVSTRALAERNHLDPPYALRVGRRLRLPDGVETTALRGLPLRDGATVGATTSARSGGHTPANGRYARPRNPGFVRFVREYNDEHMSLNLRRITPTVRRRMENFLRFTDGRHHPMNPRLLRQIAIVSDHFGGRPLHVVSGFRPFRHGQWTAHSNHNVGAAMDFRIEGVSNRMLRDFCRTLPQTGCGFYPRSVFVHMDVREESATWVDWSRPGQRPMYGREDRPPGDHPHGSAVAHEEPAPAGADESVDDVAADDQHVRTATPSPDDETDEHAPTAAAPNEPANGTAGTQ